MSQMLDLRCPVDRRRMFGRLSVTPGMVIVPGNLMEFSCDKCRRSQGRPVFHRFDFAGRLVETVTGPWEE